MNKEQKQQHNQVIKCEFCNCSFSEKNKKFIHHDHIIGENMKSICNNCNLKYQYKNFVPVYIHNVKGYNSHFLIMLNTYGYILDDIITCIPSTHEKYISFSKKN